MGNLFFHCFPLACVLRCNPTVLSTGALDFALIKFRMARSNKFDWQVNRNGERATRSCTLVKIMI